MTELAPALASATAGDRAAERARAVLLVVLAAIGALYLAFGLYYGALVATPPLVNRSGAAAGGDFVAFWAATTLAVAGDPASAYDPARFSSVIMSVAPVFDRPNPWSYPPVVMLMLRPLGWLDAMPALLLWYAAIASAALAAVRVATGRWTAAGWALLFPPVVHSLINGQNGTITALLLAAVVACFRRAPVVAGLALGLLAYKPHLAVVPACLALAFGAWRVLAAAALIAAVLVATSLALDGGAPWAGFLAQSQAQLALMTSGRIPIHRLVTPFALFFAAGVPATLALALHGVAALAAIAAAIHVWRRDEDLLPRALSLMLAAVLVTPYAYDYDLAILVVPAALLLSRGPSPFVLDDVAMRWLVALALAPVLTLVLAAGSKIPFGTLAIVAALAVVALRPRWLPRTLPA
jgi:hypothetical protein